MCYGTNPSSVRVFSRFSRGHGTRRSWQESPKDQCRAVARAMSDGTQRQGTPRIFLCRLPSAGCDARGTGRQNELDAPRASSRGVRREAHWSRATLVHVPRGRSTLARIVPWTLSTWLVVDDLRGKCSTTRTSSLVGLLRRYRRPWRSIFRVGRLCHKPPSSAAGTGPGEHSTSLVPKRCLGVYTWPWHQRSPRGHEEHVRSRTVRQTHWRSRRLVRRWRCASEGSIPGWACATFQALEGGCCCCCSCYSRRCIRRRECGRQGVTEGLLLPVFLHFCLLSSFRPSFPPLWARRGNSVRQRPNPRASFDLVDRVSRTFCCSLPILARDRDSLCRFRSPL